MNSPTKSGARFYKNGNLTAAQLPEIDWAADYNLTATTLYRWVEQAAISTLDWYLVEKKAKARWSRRLRVLAVMFITAGTLAPVIAVGVNNVKYAFWGYPALGLGAACIGLDRAFGLSSSWMRYLSAAAAIQKILISYQLRWAEITGSWGNGQIEANQMQSAVKEIVAFAEKLSDLVAEETESWVAEFRGNVTLLETEIAKV